jgi:hypothetical protein
MMLKIAKTTVSATSAAVKRHIHYGVIKLLSI